MPLVAEHSPSTPDDLLDEMRLSRQEYFELEQEWDTLLARAHTFGRPSEIIEALQGANDLGQEVLAALARYQSAVRALVRSMKRK
jgi:hypothetical protein